MELFLGLIFGAVLGVYLGISIARETPSDYEDIGDSVERVGQHYVYGLDASLDDTTPPDAPLEEITEEVNCKAVRDAEDFLMSLADLEDMGE
jgi:hypothetical protein